MRKTNSPPMRPLEIIGHYSNNLFATLGYASDIANEIMSLGSWTSTIKLFSVSENSYKSVCYKGFYIHRNGTKWGGAIIVSCQKSS